MPLFRFATVLATCLLLLTFPDVSRAQTDPHAPQSDAESHYQAAVRLYGEGRYRESLDEFDAAIALSPESIFYCNRAVVLIKLQELQEALQSLRLCRDTFTGDAGELAQIDAQTLGLERYLQIVGPTAHEIASRAAAGPVPATGSSRRGWTLSDFGYLSLGIGSALLASAATLDVLSADLVTQFVEESDGGNRSRYRELRAEVERRQRIWYGLTISGGVFAATGISLVLAHFLSANESAARQVWFTPIGGREGFGVAAGLRF